MPSTALEAPVDDAENHGRVRPTRRASRLKPAERISRPRTFLRVRSVAQPVMRHAMDLALIAGVDSGTIRPLERRHLTDEGILV